MDKKRFFQNILTALSIVFAGVSVIQIASFFLTW